MRITAPTYTQTPNDLFDHWLPLLNEGELKVLLVIMRKTFGWHRTHDVISVSQLSKYTGMLEETVIKAARSLQNKGVITREVSGPIGKQQTTYSLIVNEDSNNLYPSDKPRGPLGSDPRVQTEAQKKEYSKENKQKETVCVAAPPVAASPLVKNILLKGCDGNHISLSFQDLFDMAIKNRKDWSEKEIDELWKVLENYQTPMRDLARFCDGTIKNMRKMKQIKEFNIKESTCQTTTQNHQKTKKENINLESNQSSNIKETISMKDMLVRPFANLNLDSLMPKRFLSS